MLNVLFTQSLFLLLFTYHISVDFLFYKVSWWSTPWPSWHTCNLFVQSVGKKKNEIKTSEQHISGQRGPTAFDVNTPVAPGCLHAGFGLSHVNKLLSSLNNPTLNSVTFKFEGRSGKEIKVAKLERYCKKYLQALFGYRKTRSPTKWCSGWG